MLEWRFPPLNGLLRWNEWFLPPLTCLPPLKSALVADTRSATLEWLLARAGSVSLQAGQLQQGIKQKPTEAMVLPSLFLPSFLACLLACLRAPVPACLRACLRACVRACLRACLLAWLMEATKSHEKQPETNQSHQKPMEASQSHPKSKEPLKATKSQRSKPKPPKPTEDTKTQQKPSQRKNNFSETS